MYISWVWSVCTCREYDHYVHVVSMITMYMSWVWSLCTNREYDQCVHVAARGPSAGRRTDEASQSLVWHERAGTQHHDGSRRADGDARRADRDCRCGQIPSSSEPWPLHSTRRLGKQHLSVGMAVWYQTHKRLMLFRWFLDTRWHVE